MRQLLVCAVSLAAVLTMSAACGEDFSSSDDGARGASGSGSEASSSGAGGGGGSGGGTPDGCVPSEEGNPVENKCGIFVSSSIASAAPDGTKEKPYKTIAEALTAAKGKPIYVCAEATPYAEEVAITQAVDIYGALDCSKGWAYDAAKRTAVAPAAPGIPLRVTEVTGSVHVEDIDFTAADATAMGASSVGAFVNASADVTMLRVAITAGKGMSGSSPMTMAFTYPPEAELTGDDAMGTFGGEAKPCACPAGDQTVGGAGGDEGGAGQDGGKGSPDYMGGQGGVVDTNCITGVGKPGNPPPTNGSDGPGALLIGTLTSRGWTPEPGGPGLHGAPGQGGGGGASDDDGSGSGAGGGCGGCGGAAGPGGGGGGASIALLVLTSGVTITNGSLIATGAGNGGGGAAGQLGQTVTGPSGIPTSGGCTGGPGGAGASGGNGGGGAGGVSAGVVFSGGTAPELPSTTISKGTAGNPGAGGTPGTNDGIAGDSKDVLEITG